MIFALFILLVVLFVGLPIIGMTLWAIFSTIVVGLIMGALGRLIVPGTQRIGFIATVLSGLCGSILGGFLGSHVFGVGHLATLLLEVAVSAVVVALFAGSARRHPSVR